MTPINNKSALNLRTALLFALSISILMNLLFIVMFFYGRPMHFRENAPEMPMHIFSLNFTLIRFVFNFLFSFFLYLLIFKLLKNDYFSQKKGVFVLVLIVLSYIALFSILISMIQQPFEPFERGTRRFFGGLMGDFTIGMVVLLSSLLIYISEKQQKMALENERLQAENMKTRFLALRNQVDPHFLFNSLNTLSSLVKTDAAKAEEYVRQLSYVFRYTLQNKDVITLDEELKFTRAYCILMQIRYGDSLRFEYRVDERYNDCPVIPISLQTLVENAIKHNIVSNRQPLVISIFTAETSICVSNPVQPKQEPEGGESIGLANLAERYRLLWNREIVIRNEGGRFEVEIPLK
ncbi:MAG: histidine kinase [Dysgonamonadaceae bacterium]|jgi:sensor histidine kinase YesM|nr:histidine kinase [Dysgonamonadaceae bacterium]